jgi:DDE family transposase
VATTTCFPTTHIHVTRALECVFTTMPNLTARRTRFRKRESKLTGSIFVQTLTFGWLDNPDATLEELAQVAGSLGVPISAQGLDQRFGPPAADLLQQVLHDAVVRVISTDPVVVPLLQRFAGGVCLLDSTTLTLPEEFAGAWPGLGPNDMLGGIKAQVRLNLLDGTLNGPFLCPARDNDRKGVLHTAPLPTGALHLADLGFFCLQHLQALDQQKVFWLTRVKSGTRLVDATGQEWTLAAFLRSQTTDTVDVSLAIGVEHPLPCRFLAMRVPPEVAALRRKRLQKRAKSRGWKMHADREALAEWNVYVTNVPQEMLSLQEAWVLARCRWQIELLFKLWKSEGHVDQSRSEKPWRILCEIYAKLLGMVVQHWLLLVGCWSHQDRSLVKASRTVRRYALALAVALPDSHLVFGILASVQICLKTGCRVKRRRRDPPTHQLLSDLPKTA